MRIQGWLPKIQPNRCRNVHKLIRAKNRPVTDPSTEKHPTGAQNIRDLICSIVLVDHVTRFRNQVTACIQTQTTKRSR
jgi:hypothetical protein